MMIDGIVNCQMQISMKKYDVEWKLIQIVND